LAFDAIQTLLFRLDGVTEPNLRILLAEELPHKAPGWLIQVISYQIN